MPNTKQGAITATWLPDQPADALAQSPNTIFSAGDLRNRIEAGFNNPCAIPGTVLLFDFTDKAATLYDKSGFQRNATGTSIDTSLYENTPFGIGYGFPGAADYFSISEFARIDEDLLTGLTIEVILKVNDYSSLTYILAKGAAGSVGYNVAVDTNGNFAFTTAGHSTPTITGSTVVSADRYYHLACTYSAMEGKALYVDGQLEAEDPSVGTITSASGGDIKLACLSGVSNFLNATVVAVRICNRALDKSEFIHHYYLRTLIDGSLGGSSVIFDESLSSFAKKKSAIITANWKKDPNQEWANFYVQTKKGTPGEIQVPDLELKDVHSGGLPEVDEYTVGYWIFNGITAQKAGTTGLVRDWSGNEHHATLVSMDSTDLVKTRFDRYYDLDGSADYYTTPHDDQLNPEMQNFTVEVFARNDNYSFADQQDYLRKFGSGSEFWLRYNQTGDFLTIHIEDDSANSISLSTPNISNLIDKNGWYHMAGAINRETNRGWIMLDGKLVLEASIATITGPVGNANVLFLGTGATGSNRVRGPMAYIRYSIGIAREPEEMRLNAMSFNSRANGIVQDLLVE